MSVSDSTGRPVVEWNSGQGAAVLAYAESVLQMSGADRTDVDERAKALRTAEDARRVTLAHRQRFIDDAHALPAAAPLAPHEKWHGFELDRARAVGFSAYEALEQQHGRNRVRAMSPRALEGALYDLRRERPNLFASVEQAQSLGEAAAALRFAKPATNMAAAVQTVAMQRPELIPHYGSPRKPAEAIQFAAQEHDNQQQWMDDAIADWRARYGAPPSQRERGQCYDQWAKKFPGRVPPSIVHHFRLPATPTVELPGPARDPLTADVRAERAPARPQGERDPRITLALGAVSHDEEKYLGQWVTAAKKWWAEQEDGDADEAKAVERFAKAFPSLAPEIIGKLFHGLPQQIAEAERDAKREALR